MVQQEANLRSAEAGFADDPLRTGRQLTAVAKGEKLNTRAVNRLAARVADIQLPRSSMSGVEKNALAFGYYVDRHVDD